jgi:chlorobactene glucosyltransferase
MLIYNIIVTTVLFVLLLILIWNLTILRRKKYAAIADAKLPFVSVLIPARNEELNIANILNSLLKQDYPNYEVIVLNDHSEDKTGKIISEIKQKHPELVVLNGKPLPEGWTGKCYACTQLHEASKGEYILFTDADTTHKPQSLMKSITIALNKEADMLTLFPEMTMVSLAEKIIMPMLWFTIMLLLPFYFIDKKGFVKFSVGIGPFMMFKRSAYEKIGGHYSVKNAIVEDVWLARKIKENRMQLIVEDGFEMLSVRMYRNLNEIWSGFSKNIFAGFEFSSFSLFAVNLLYILLFFLPFMLLIIELSLYEIRNYGANLALILVVFQIFILYLARTLISIRFKLGILSTILHPLGALSVPVIALNSWRWIKLGKGASWKGRVYNPAKK